MRAKVSQHVAWQMRDWQPHCWTCAGSRASAAIASFSVLVTLTAVALAWGIASCIKRRKRYRAKYDLFPSDMFNTRDLNWYPPSDYRTAVVGVEGDSTGTPCVLGRESTLDLPACIAVAAVCVAQKRISVEICMPAHHPRSLLPACLC